MSFVIGGGSNNNNNTNNNYNQGYQQQQQQQQQKNMPDPTALLNLGGGNNMNRGGSYGSGNYGSGNYGSGNYGSGNYGNNQYNQQQQKYNNNNNNKGQICQQYNYGDNNYGRDSWFKQVRKNEKIFFNPHPNQLYKITSCMGKNMCLDVNMQANKICLWTYKNSDNQKYRFQMQNNRITIYPLATQGKCLQIKGGIMGDNIDIVPGVPNGQVYQKFEFVPSHYEDAKPNQFFIRSFCNKTLDLARQATTDGSEVIQYHFHAGYNQLWRIQPV